jgi:DNA-nicking Smr family endonuclease
VPGKSRKPDAAEGEALWQRVVEDVRPLKERRARLLATAAKQATLEQTLAKQNSVRPEPVEGRAASEPPAARPSTKLRTNGMSVANVRPPQNTLDASWDRKLARGIVAPDLAIDLHGHTLSSAHAELEAGLTRAVAMQARLILLVTGRPPPPGRSRLDNPLRGVIRASIGDWLHHSRNAASIAAVRNAHPRHGGAGALYVILRRAGR